MPMDEPVIGQPSGATASERLTADSGEVETPPPAAPPATSPPDAEVFRPGVALQVAYAGPTRAPAFNAAVAGVDADGIAIDLGRKASSQPAPGSGEPVVLVVRSKQQLQAFDCEVTGIEESRSLMLVTPPVEARRPERRMATRVVVGVPLRSGVWLDPRGGEFPIHGGTVIDVSVGGLQLRSLQYVGLASIVRLAFVLHPAERPVHVQGMVVGCADEDRSTALRVHVQFLEMPEDSREQVARYVQRVSARARKTA